MKNFNLIIRLTSSYTSYQKEVDLSYQDPEYALFFTKCSFYDIMEQVAQASVMYPRSEDECAACITDLAHGFANNLGVGQFELSDDSTDSLAALITKIGVEVQQQLETAGYYIHPSRYPKWLSVDDVDEYVTDVTAACDLRRVSRDSFLLKIDEHHFEDSINEDILQHSVQSYTTLFKEH